MCSLVYMGRIRTNFIKGLSKQLFESAPEKWNGFETNKKVLDEMQIIDEKFTRNKVAGYIVRLVDKKAKVVA